ncbi:MAG TPA: hypothetical protein VLK28_06185, partial [Methylomirabilota bacterium]|nr:hypothetical protein [Methylomirabilota bacterium]
MPAARGPGLEAAGCPALDPAGPGVEAVGGLAGEGPRLLAWSLGPQWPGRRGGTLRHARLEGGLAPRLAGGLGGGSA